MRAGYHLPRPDEIYPSNVVLTLGNGGKAGTVYMLLVAIFGLFLVCLCKAKHFNEKDT